MRALDDSGMNVLHFASRGGHVPTIEKVLSRGKELLDSRTNDGASPLMKAAANGHEDAVTYLLTCGADPVVAMNDGWTPLHIASACGHLRMLEKLLTLSIDINSKTSLGLTPLHFAAFNGNLDAVNSLIEHGADQTAVDKDSKSVLHFAAEGGNTATIERMLKLPIDVNCRDSQGGTPLHHAACRGNLDAVNFLIGHGADQTTESTFGNLLHYAEEGGDVKTIEQVLTLSFLVDSKSSEGETPLHRAALGGNVSAVDLLLSRGATPTGIQCNLSILRHIIRTPF